MNYVFMAMGTAVSVIGEQESMPEVEAVFAELDERFSLYRPASEASQLARGDLLLPHASSELRTMYALAHDWRQATDGAFRPHRPDGVIDLAGVVKAKAIERAGQVLARSGVPWLINAGGDVLTSGDSFVVGIVDPDDRGALLSQFTCRPELPAVATSGTTERGEHIWRAGTTDEFCQVSVAGPDIMTADVLATAIMAGGRDTLDAMVAKYDIQVLAVTRAGEYFVTAAFRADEPPASRMAG